MLGCGTCRKNGKILYTIDEITGLINACADYAPFQERAGFGVKEREEKIQDRSFAAGVSREVIQKGAEMLGMPLDEIITETILGMRNAAEEIGLKGNL